MRSVIVAGCAGFLGSHLTSYLLQKGYQVIGIDDLSNGSVDFLIKDQNLKFYHAPLEEFEIAYGLFSDIQDKYSPVAIYHFAGYDFGEISPFTRFSNYNHNLMISSNIINACMQYGWKIIFGSSASVYGRKNDPPFSESMTPNPNNPFDISKYATELDIINSSNQFGFNYNILRIDNLVGKKFNIDPPNYSNILQYFIKNIIDNKPIVIIGDGLEKISFLDVNFCLKPLSLLIDSNDIILPENNNQIFNIGGATVCTINQIADLILDIAKEFNINGYKLFDKEEIYIPYSKYCDISKSKEILGLFDGTSIKEIIRETFKWYLSSPPKSNRNIFYETDEDLYSFLSNTKNAEITVEIQKKKSEIVNNFNKKSQTVYE